jgi:hypothetical protein
MFDNLQYLLQKIQLKNKFYFKDFFKINSLQRQGQVNFGDAELL